MQTRIVTAETEEGRDAIEEVMAHSYRADTEEVQPAWLRALVVDDVPVSFIRVEPDITVDLPGGRLRAAFVSDVATRDDRQRQGHFRRLMETTCAALREEGLSLLTLHGDYHYYRPLGFEVWTHHCGLFITPEAIEQRLGAAPEGARAELREVGERQPSIPDLLLVQDVRAGTAEAAKGALLAAAALARERGKGRILFEHPRADHSLHPTLETPFAEFARLCGAAQHVCPDDPESCGVPDGDWMKVLDTQQFLRDAVPLCPVQEDALPHAAVTFDTDAGTATLRASAEGVTVTEGPASDASCLTWPGNAVGQLVLGYASAPALAARHSTPLPPEPMALLNTLFSHGWRLSRNEEWVYTS